MATIVSSKYFGQVVTNNAWLYSYKCGPKETLSLPDPQYCCYCFIFLCRLPCCCPSISWPRRSPSLIPGTLSWLWLRTTPWAMPFKSTPSTDAKSRECCPPITTQIIYWSKMIVHFVVPPLRSLLRKQLILVPKSDAEATSSAIMQRSVLPDLTSTDLFSSIWFFFNFFFLLVLGCRRFPRLLRRPHCQRPRRSSYHHPTGTRCVIYYRIQSASPLF